jgi:hypothetical protein
MHGRNTFRTGFRAGYANSQCDRDECEWLSDQLVRYLVDDGNCGDTSLLHYLDSERGYLTFLTAGLMFLFLSPMFVNASINAVRQGLAALLVFTALLAFHRRQWRNFIVYGALASSFHYSSLLYLAFAPMLSTQSPYIANGRSWRVCRLLHGIDA